MSSCATGRGGAGFTLVEVIVVMTVMSVAVAIFASTVLAGAQQRAINREKAIAVDAARTIIERMHNEKFGQVFALYNGLAEDDPGGAGTAPGHRFDVRGLTAWASAADGLHGEVVFPTVEQAVVVGVKPTGPQTLTEDQLDGIVGLLSGELKGLGGGLGGGGGGLLGGGGPGGQLLLGGLGGGETTTTTTTTTTTRERTEPEPASDPGWILREDVDLPALGMPRDLNGDNVVDSDDHRGDYILLPVCVRIRWTGRTGERELRVTTMLTDFVK